MLSAAEKGKEKGSRKGPFRPKVFSQSECTIQKGSFRDFQTWEYVPLGPFTAKNGISTVSPWIVTVDALEGCEVPLVNQDPEPLAYLKEKNHISYDISLNVAIKTPKMEAPE